MRPCLLILLPLLGCTPEDYVRSADNQVYGILERVSAHVTGDAKVFPVGLKEGTLREHLLAEPEVVQLDLMTALDIAAENSRAYARQKENLYGVALTLTREQHQFAVVFGAGASAAVSGIGNDEIDFSVADDLSASVNTVSGGRIVFSFVNTFLKSLINGGGWDGSSILNLAITQPLLRGAGTEIAREPLTQAERDVVYAVREFAHFRATLAVDVLSDYFGVAQQMRDLENVRANYQSVKSSREQIDALFRAGRRSIDDVDRARQDELRAENRIVAALNSLETTLDRFKFTLGLPVDATVELDPAELDRLRGIGVVELAIDSETAIQLALERRYDYRTARDRTEDASRQVLVAENALQSVLDFSAAFSVPTEPGKPFKFDWSQVNWSAGFDLDLALDRLNERNVYRRALINLDDRIRSREELQDVIKSEIRSELRDIQSRVESYRIQELAVTLAQRRVDSTGALYEAGRAQAIDVLDAEDALLEARLLLTGALVDYAVARMQLLRDMEAISLEPKGLRFDLALPMPTGPRNHADDLPDDPEPAPAGGKDP